MIGAGVEEEPPAIGGAAQPYAHQLGSGEEVGDDLREALDEAVERPRPRGAPPTVEGALRDDLALRRVAPQGIVDDGDVGLPARLAERLGEKQPMRAFAQDEGGAQRGCGADRLIDRATLELRRLRRIDKPGMPRPFEERRIVGASCTRRCRRRRSPQCAGVTCLADGSMPLALSAAIEPIDAQTLRAFLSPAIAASWFFLVVFGSLAAFTIYLRLVRDWGTAKAGMYAFVSPSSPW
jgi:hypothetical protein